ncbi:hypothetical protein RRG08_006962 [Elysia crispata]|uniref:Uncharacterized protein n=1 Tax=Elysia crispata TaxID=231223 RepID=A0AAE1DAP2_9GAST|nr:hypothetical protein RRG08_006962 [Elysia crispata]
MEVGHNRPKNIGQWRLSPSMQGRGACLSTYTLTPVQAASHHTTPLAAGGHRPRPRTHGSESSMISGYTQHVSAGQGAGSESSPDTTNTVGHPATYIAQSGGGGGVRVENLS